MCPFGQKWWSYLTPKELSISWCSFPLLPQTYGSMDAPFLSYHQIFSAVVKTIGAEWAAPIKPVMFTSEPSLQGSSSLCPSYYISTHHPLLPGVLNVDSLWVSLNLVLLSAFWFSFFWASVGSYHLNLIPEIISSCLWSPCSTRHVMDSLCPFSWHPHGIFALAGTGFLRNYHVQTWPVSLLLEHLSPFSWIPFVYTILFGGAMSPFSSLHN